MAFLPAPQTFGSQFGAGLGQGIAATLPEKLEQFITTKRTQREKSSINQKIEALGENATLTDKMGIWLGSDLSPEDKKQGYEVLKNEGATAFAEKFKNQNYTIGDIVEGTSLGYITPGLAPILASPLIKDPMEQQLLQQFFGGGGQPGIGGEEQPAPGIQEDISVGLEDRVTQDSTAQQGAKEAAPGEETVRPPRRTSPIIDNEGRKKLLQRMMTTKGPLANLAKTELASIEKSEERQFKKTEKEEERGFQTAEKEEKRIFEEKKRKEEAEARTKETAEKRAFDRNKSYLDRISDIAVELPKERVALQQMRGALDDKSFNSWRNVVAEMTGVETLKTASAQVLNSASKQFLMSSLAGLTGRPNQFIEKQITKALISPLYRNEANELIYEGLEGLNKLKEREVQIAEDLEDFYTSKGEEIPRTFQKMVRAQHKQEVDDFENRYEQRVKQLLSSKDAKSDEVRMTDPDGKLRNVPKKDAKKAQDAGYKLVK